MVVFDVYRLEDVRPSLISSYVADDFHVPEHELYAHVVLIFFFLMIRRPPSSTLFPSPPLFRSAPPPSPGPLQCCRLNLIPINVPCRRAGLDRRIRRARRPASECAPPVLHSVDDAPRNISNRWRSEEHTSELQSPCNLVCRLLLE